MAPSTRPKSTACWPRTTEGTFQPSRRDHYGGSDPPKGEGSWCAHKGAPATLPRCRTSGLKRGVAPSMMTRPARHLPDGGMARRAVRFCRGELEGFAAPLYRCGFGHLSGKAGHSGGGVPPLGERLRARTTSAHQAPFVECAPICRHGSDHHRVNPSILPPSALLPVLLITSFRPPCCSIVSQSPSSGSPGCPRRSHGDGVPPGSRSTSSTYFFSPKESQQLRNK